MFEFQTVSGNKIKLIEERLGSKKRNYEYQQKRGRDKLWQNEGTERNRDGQRAREKAGAHES